MAQAVSVWTAAVSREVWREMHHPNIVTLKVGFDSGSGRFCLSGSFA